ncbi:flagellar biosynthesis protein FlhA [Clostridium acetobutylicum]|uniref:Flagellar biosynthesis protein FlhA n=2 Tax=Bacteria TaxID=2 RepID=Q97H66_CLOAB|nr:MULTISPECIES: flagellar biosynthesis protein FlhA [Clostridium]AAK80105.1 Flagellar biosynthesis protein FlhA [Clostridium acetobutylicum ATCC 824]ADZ21198.1 flagellar biosynthesis protein A [Clostridium acetobutylicum EA 2018]AEI34111.1 flagellar biosynthesis protein FlhA [Clostridium acetobutylicum DSM 1731]AWV79470.1 flagellar biosynthesis protein FlhA [Clostridium acetobutylicum]MBC2394559.1 flagellar biosynthesis protein FlhA [Clostridium acetobutylicum]
MEEGRRLKFNVKDNRDVIVSLAIVGIVIMMIVPLPAKVLDFFIAFNITMSVIIILLTMFITEALQFSVFPTLLLVTTLFRISLNISSTRLILLNGYAGDIISAFGSFVVGGNYVVGIIIFLIIIIVQFVVITNGSGRVAEVAARFTLDAMPGKQMTIDADLNAGLITEEEAKTKRKNLQLEADFFGAMDGASKFVKGDAVSSLIICAINIIGGIIMGVLMRNLSIAQAAQQYVILTIGDGLVSQVPALLISVATGILVTRSKNNESLGNELLGQVTAFPKVLALASVVLFTLAIIPGFPHLVFLILATAMGVSAYLLFKDEMSQKIIEAETQNMQVMEKEKREPENVMKLISVEPMEIEIGYGLIPLADENSGGDLLQRIASVRRQCAIEMGVVVQPIRIRDNLQLKTNEYVVKIRGTIVSKGELMPNMLLCMDPANENSDIKGIRTIEPTFGLPAMWINKDQREDAEIRGLTVVDPTTVMITHLTETVKDHSFELLGRQEVKEIVDSMKEKYSAVVEELIPDLLTIGELQKILQNLLKEKIPVKDMVTIMECLADNSRNTKDIELLTEYVRMSLGRTICSNLVDENNSMVVATLSPEVENLIANNIQKSSVQGSFPAISPDVTTNLLNSIKQVVSTVNFNDGQPAILVSPKIRPAFRKLIEMVFPGVAVLSLNEIPNDIQIRTEGVVNL